MPLPTLNSCRIYEGLILILQKERERERERDGDRGRERQRDREAEILTPPFHIALKSKELCFGLLSVSLNCLALQKNLCIYPA